MSLFSIPAFSPHVMHNLGQESRLKRDKVDPSINVSSELIFSLWNLFLQIDFLPPILRKFILRKFIFRTFFQL